MKIQEFQSLTREEVLAVSRNLRDGQKALDHVCRKLGVEPYGTTADGRFTVQPSECLGACADAPVMLVNDRQMLSYMSNERVDELIETLKKVFPDNKE